MVDSFLIGMAVGFSAYTAFAISKLQVQWSRELKVWESVLQWMRTQEKMNLEVAQEVDRLNDRLAKAKNAGGKPGETSYKTRLE